MAALAPLPEKPLVSVIMPSYNQAAYLEEAILSVLNQGYPNVKLLIIDGGSKDGSVEIIRKYADRLAYWVSEKDSGQSEAVNKGFARAQGEIVGWLNSDDLFLPGAISAGVAGLLANPDCGMVYGDARAIDAAGKTTNIMRSGHGDLDGLMRFEVICQPASFIRRDVLLQSGFLDPTFHLLLDHQLWLRVAQVAPIRYIGGVLAAARYHEGAKNVSQTSGYGKDAYRLIEWMPAQPGLAERFARNRRKILAGAHRLNAYYLLNGGAYGPALRAYGKSLINYPPIALRETHRIVFAAVSLVFNVERFRTWYIAARRKIVVKN